MTYVEAFGICTTVFTIAVLVLGLFVIASIPSRETQAHRHRCAFCPQRVGCPYTRPTPVGFLCSGPTDPRFLGILCESCYARQEGVREHMA